MLEGVSLRLSVLILIISIFFIGCEKKTSYKKHTEKYYQQKFCKVVGGKMEVRLKDRTRVDCLTSEYAIEVDFAKKWAEGIGQSLYYALMTGKKPAVALIIGEKDKRYLKRAKKVAKKYKIKILTIKKGYK